MRTVSLINGYLEATCFDIGCVQRSHLKSVQQLLGITRRPFHAVHNDLRFAPSVIPRLRSQCWYLAQIDLPLCSSWRCIPIGSNCHNFKLLFFFFLDPIQKQKLEHGCPGEEASDRRWPYSAVHGQILHLVWHWYASMDFESSNHVLAFVFQCISSDSRLEIRQYCSKTNVGGILSCGLTHWIVTPLDLIKCNAQANPKEFPNTVAGFKTVYSGRAVGIKPGIVGLFKGGGPTLVGYSVQGLGKFGFYEVCNFFFSLGGR